MTILVGDPISAALLLGRIRWQCKALHQVTFATHKIAFRSEDEQVLREVLVEREYAFLDRTLWNSSAPRVLDVGAHIGTFALWLLSIIPSARILSVEADPTTVKVAERNALSLRSKGFDWTVLHAAAGDRDGEILQLSTEGLSMSHRIDPAGTLEVGSVSLDSLLDYLAPNGGAVDLVKVDIEGSEEAFLCSSPDALARVSELVIELQPYLCNTRRVENVLKAHFSSIVAIVGRTSSKPLLYCRRTS